MKRLSDLSMRAAMLQESHTQEVGMVKNPGRWLGAKIAWNFSPLAVLLLCTIPTAAQQLNVGGTTQVYTALGYQQVAAGGLASAVPLPSVPAGVRMVQVCVEAQAVRWRDDGVAPTAAIGMPLAIGNCLIYTGPVSALQFIQQTAGAILDVSYYR